MATPVSGANRWLTLNDQPLQFSPATDNLAAGAVEYDINRLRVTHAAPDDVTIRIDRELLETEVYGRWSWRPAGFAGLYSFEVSAPGHGTHQTQVRVLPSKFSHERYERMLKEIGDFSADLLFQLHSPASERVTSADLEEMQSPLRTYHMVEGLLKELRPTLAQLERMPQQQLVGVSERRMWYEVAAFSAEAQPVTGPMVAAPAGMVGLSSAWPQQWQVTRRELTFDVYENRLLKQFLWRKLLPRLYELESRARQEMTRRCDTLAIYRRNGWDASAEEEARRIAELEAVAETVTRWQRDVIGWGSMSFLQHVRSTTQRSVPTQVLQKHPAYGRFYQLYLRFQRELKRGLSAEGYLTRIALRKMSELYELWAVFRLTQLLVFLLRRLGYQIVSSDGFFRVDDDYFHFEVDRKAAIVLAKDDRRVHIRYEPLYSAERTVTEGIVTARSYYRTPDMALEVWQNGTAQAVVIFDAKYKTDEQFGRMQFVADDLQKMSAYYAEIAWKERGSRRRPTPVVSSAYILYPGEVLEHNRDYPEVGALPLVPGPHQKPEVLHALLDILRNASLA